MTLSSIKGVNRKMMISEKPVKSKALEERSFNYECRSAIKDNLISIKEVTINPPDDPGKQALYKKVDAVLST
jgi:hypothetical protein